MDESDHPTKPGEQSPTPEVAQLLKLLEIQGAARRGRQQGAPNVFQGASFRYGSLAFILVFAIAAVAGMEWMVSQLPRPDHNAPVSPATVIDGPSQSGSKVKKPGEK